MRVVHIKKEPWTVQVSRPMEVIRKLPEDAVLACWCHPETCHGDVVMKIWKELHS